MAFYFPQSDDGQSQSQRDESNGDPLGHLGQLGVQALSLVLGQEGVSAAGDGAGQASTLAGLQHDDSDQSQGQDHLEDSDSELHGKIVPFNAWRAKRDMTYLWPQTRITKKDTTIISENQELF